MYVLTSRTATAITHAHVLYIVHVHRCIHVHVFTPLIGLSRRMLSRLCFSNQADTSSSVSGEYLHSQTKKEAIRTPMATFPVDMLFA